MTGVIIGLASGMFLVGLEATAVGGLLPRIVLGMGTIDAYGWLCTAHLVATTIGIAGWGLLSDRYGRRAAYAGAIVLFATGSMACALATNLPVFCAARIVQGLGAGGIVPIGLAALHDLFDLRTRARLQIFFSGAWALAALAGPVFATLCSEFLSWRFVFAAFAPCGFAALWLAGRRLPRSPTRRVSSGSMAMSPITIPASITIFLTGAFVFSLMAYVPLWAERIVHASANEIAFSLTPILLGWVVAAVVAVRWLIFAGYRTPVRGGLALACAAITYLASSHAPTAGVAFVALACVGIGVGLAVPALLIGMQQAALPTSVGQVTSTNHLCRQLGGIVGTALLGIVAASTNSQPSAEATTLDHSAPLRQALVLNAGFAGLALLASLNLPHVPPFNQLTDTQ